MNIYESGGLRFYCRPGSSDEKTVKEVVGRKVYLKKELKILPGEKWLDLGGNIGAFTVFACSRGAQVTTYEPDPQNVAMIKKNLSLNGLKAEVHTRAIVHDNRTGDTLHLWPGAQSWRNSLVRNKKGTLPMTVFCENFFNIARPEHCVKMDIEGSEIAILEAWPPSFRVTKLVFEYSFDVDPSVERLRRILEKLRTIFRSVLHAKQVASLQQWNFFPPCTMVHCF